MTVIIVALLLGKSKEEWYDLVAERVKNKDGPVAPKRFGIILTYENSLTIARFLGPGVNQFQNWNNRNDEPEPSDEDATGAKKSAQQQRQDDENEGWTDWKNGEDIRSRFSRGRNPGRVIHLGDGSGLVISQASGHEDTHEHDMTVSSSDDESYEEDDDHKMQVDGVHPESEKDSKTTALDTTDIAAPKTEMRHKSPTPASTSAEVAPQTPDEK